MKTLSSPRLTDARYCDLVPALGISHIDLVKPDDEAQRVPQDSEKEIVIIGAPRTPIGKASSRLQEPNHLPVARTAAGSRRAGAVDDAIERPAPESEAFLLRLAQSPLDLRLRDQIRV